MRYISTREQAPACDPTRVLGAGSIGTQDVARNSLVAGVPARVIRNNVGWTRVPNPDKESGRKIREYKRSLGML